ncbi:MAG TPA: helix-turn-helix domain-containing protein, partial [Verrucomicrobiae bacterium]|nr:helix-turn-helix domain-containing protein [Verrucomicrobiae bacterium]
MESIGKTLMEARLSKGLSLGEVEELTKIRTHYLQALEEDKFGILPGHTYVLGFIRTYARALGLDPQELSDAYKAISIPPQQELKPMEPVAPSVDKNPRSLSRGLVIAGLCGLALLTLFGVDSLWKKGQNAPPTEPVSKPPLVSGEQNNQTPPQQTPPQQTVPQQTAPQQPAPQPVTE